MWWFEMPKQERRVRGEFLNNTIPWGKLHNSDLFRNSKVGWFLRQPNWKNIQLQPFEKNLYEEHPVTAIRSMSEVEAYRNANGVWVRGRDVPKPILALEESNFPEFIVKGIEARNDYTSPMPIEANCWPIALSCRNFLGVAETGSHKMVAYVLPAVIHVSRQPPRQRHEGPIAVLLAPTRELAKEIHKMASELGKYAAVRSVCAANGERKKSKYLELQGGCHILVATPGCLMEFLEEGKVNLHQCTYLVFDEVDRMLTMGYEPHVLKIVELCRPDHQTIMWATSWHKNLKPLVEDMLDDYIEIRCVTTPLPVENSLEMTVDVCLEEDKEAKLAELLDDVLKEKADRAMVFADTTRKVEKIALKLRTRAWPAIGLHGKMKKKERGWALSMFSGGGESVLVTTDMAVQDLVLPDVRLVVNYDCPDCSKVYAHRSRHALRSDQPSTVHTFLLPTENCQAKTLIEILQDARQPVSHELFELAKIVRSKR
ncbi:probable ATP-dependent RNA helicase DDX5 [Rhipicephalus sanguineus]|uniref:RNA helicase n=1 Tax=Rhipicephalus sanguineus TaxID=34632 RepID=A0A9D4PF42_RHISA|nr:probable ATP-dependent RNA helicase DDX5 [Rhipicephalus sanguineus]KAH7936253.1 hypothetical protein HPB52_020851 [Rhipicephalus sanguineus]